MNWQEIRKEFESSSITLKALAEKHDIKIGTLKSRKSREEWSRDPSEKDATKKKKVATIKKDATPKEVFVESEGLTDKQRLFCIYYIKSFNATQSAIKAGYAPESAHVEGHRLLKNAKVADEVRRVKNEMRQGIFIDVMDILDKYIQIAFADITDYTVFGKKMVQAMGAFGPLVDDEGEPVMVEVNYVDFKESYQVDDTIISEVKKGKDSPVIKHADKMKALEMLSRYFDLLSENDRKKLQEERLKVDIAKGNAEIEKLNGDDDEGRIEILISRKGSR